MLTSSFPPHLGAEYSLYASDVTRTMPLSPWNPGHWPSAEAEAIYTHVSQIQESCIAKLRPGVHLIDLYFHSLHMAIDALLDLRILKGEHMEIFYAGTVAAFYPHGLGHHLGLEVHDVQPPRKRNDGKRTAKDKKKEKKDPRFRDIQKAYTRFSLSNPSYPSSSEPSAYNINPLNPTLFLSPNTPSDPPLAPGMVITIEPGLYFNRYILETYFLDNPVHREFIDRDVLERYMRVGGVRIEDDVLITRDGWENLTTAPKGEVMLGVIREGAEAWKGGAEE